MVCSKDDFAFALRDVEERVGLIANATLMVCDQGQQAKRNRRPGFWAAVACGGEGGI